MGTVNLPALSSWIDLEQVLCSQKVIGSLIHVTLASKDLSCHDGYSCSSQGLKLGGTADGLFPTETCTAVL